MAEVTQRRQSDNLEESQTKGDPLQNIPVEDLEDLLNILRTDIPRDLSAVGMVKNLIRWRRNKDTSANHQIYAPFGDFKNGACISVFKIPEISYELVSFYSQDLHDLKTVDALVQTKLISWGENGSFTGFYAVSEKMTSLVNELVSKKNVEMRYWHRTELFWMGKKEASNLYVECPPDVKLEELTVKHIDFLDEYWPHRFEGSKVYLRTLLESNFGLGVFLPPANDPVAWAVVSISSAITMLFTLPTQRRRGYARLVCTAIAKKLGEIGVDPYGTVMDDNHTSKMMFKSLGFKTGGYCNFVGLSPKAV